MISASRTKPEEFPRSEIALVCDDRLRGERLLEAIDLPGRPIFDVRARLGGWEIVPAGTVVFWDENPDISRLRRQVRLSRERARVVVIVDPVHHDAVELALREGATVIALPASDPTLPGELEACLGSGDDRGIVVDGAELSVELNLALERKLQRTSPRVRLVGTGRLEALVERLATQVLAEARAVAAAAPIADLDWEHISTAVQTHEESGLYRVRAAEGAPMRDGPPYELVGPALLDSGDALAETGPYAPPNQERSLAPEDRPLPPPVRTRSPAFEPEQVPAWAAVVAVLLVASAGAFAAILIWSQYDVPAPPRRVAILELGVPSVTPVIAPVVSPAETAPAVAPVAEPAEEPVEVVLPDRLERARRASIRARSHLRFGRPSRALRSARLAARLAPENLSYRALLAELDGAPADAPIDAPPADSATLEE